MMSPREFAEAWGWDKLLPIASSVLQTLAISESSKLFLREAGLPQEAMPNLTFYSTPDALAPLPTVLEEIDFPVDFQHYYLLADDGGTFLCIDTDNKEHIISVDAYQELPNRFVNSTVLEFAECLLAYRGLPEPQKAKTMTKQAIREKLDQLKIQFNQIDMAALSHPDNWWSVVIEELEIFTH